MKRSIIFVVAWAVIGSTVEILFPNLSMSASWFLGAVFVTVFPPFEEKRSA